MFASGQSTIRGIKNLIKPHRPSSTFQIFGRELERGPNLHSCPSHPALVDGEGCEVVADERKNGVQ